MTDYPKPSYTADCVVLRPDLKGYSVLLIRRGKAPFTGMWALPGGFVNYNEPGRAAASRELHEETGVVAKPFLAVGVADKANRDPRGWTVSSVWAFVVPESAQARAGDDAAAAEWFPWGHINARDLAFDHAEILALAHERFGELLKVRGAWKALLPARQSATPAWKKKIERVFRHKPVSPKAKSRA